MHSTAFAGVPRRTALRRLNDRNDLWQILVLITVRKAIDLRKHEGRAFARDGTSPEPE